MNKKGAMEMSVGTIVTIVLLMAVLVLGIFLVQRIFKSATGAVDLTDEQLRSEIYKLFGEDKELVIYPSSGRVEIKQEETDGVGIGIKNLLTGVSGTQTFSYEVVVSDASDCVETESEIEEWFTVGRAESDIPIAVGDSAVQKVLFRIPSGTSLCTARFRVNVEVGGEAYKTDVFDITVKAK
jgi:hypothetical protein